MFFDAPESALPSNLSARVLKFLPVGIAPGTYQLSVSGTVEHLEANGNRVVPVKDRFASALSLSWIQPVSPVLRMPKNQVQPGESAEIELDVTPGIFVAGWVEASFGSGISVFGYPEGSFGEVQVINGTKAVARLKVSEFAEAGPRAAEVRVGSSLFTQPFAVGKPQQIPPSYITLVGSSSSSSCAWGKVCVIKVQGVNTHFDAGTKLYCSKLPVAMPDATQPYSSTEFTTTLNLPSDPNGGTLDCVAVAITANKREVAGIQGK